MITTRTSSLRTKQIFSPDMTTLADMVFLLIAFFMLSAGFLPKEPVVVKLPQSSASFTCSLRYTDPLSLTIANDGRLFFDMDGSQSRVMLIKAVGEKYGVAFSEKQLADFAGMGSFGIDINQLPAYLALRADDRKYMKQTGIPRHQLSDWLECARKINPKFSIFIKADEAVRYPTIKAVIDVLQELDIHRMTLVTHTEPYEI